VREIDAAIDFESIRETVTHTVYEEEALLALLYHVYKWLKGLIGGLESNRSAQGKPKAVWFKNIAIAFFDC
jgi:hypothetical protein